MTITRREDLAWAAGLWDGEGHISSRDNCSGGRQIKMLMTQKDRRVLDRLESILGGKIYPRKSQGQWSWQLARRNDVMSACWLMWTWLDDIKREQFEKAFQDYHALA